MTEEKETIKEVNAIATDVAGYMKKVAENIAKLGVEGDADEQMKIITENNQKALDVVYEMLKQYELIPPPANTRLLGWPDCKDK